MSLRRTVILSACWALFTSAPAAACGFREGAGGVVTLRQHATTQFILVGHLENARGTAQAGTTDFVITQTIKGDAALAGKKFVTIPWLLPIPDPKNPPQFLVRGAAKGGTVAINDGFPASPALEAYVKGLLKIDAKDRVGLMRYAFDFLEHDDETVSADALAVFVTSPDPDIRTAAQKLAPEKLRGWLRAKPTSPDRPRLYAYLLGNCGTAADAKLLRAILDKCIEDMSLSRLDGIFTGYTLLDPKAGWKYACDVMKLECRFTVHYSALRAARYFRTTQPEVLTEADILRVVGAALDHPDVADFAVDYLREWECWKHTDRVLALATKACFEARVVQGSVIRYALRCPGAEAAKFVAERRKADPENVKLREEQNQAEARPMKP
jgi:hypothetical protein